MCAFLASVLLFFVSLTVTSLLKRINFQGSVAYIPQQPWIQNMTLRDNITFGSAMDVQKYESVVEACELKADFEMLPAGDLTEIGERVDWIFSYFFSYFKYFRSVCFAELFSFLNEIAKASLHCNLM